MLYNPVLEVSLYQLARSKDTGTPVLCLITTLSLIPEPMYKAFFPIEGISLYIGCFIFRKVSTQYIPVKRQTPFLRTVSFDDVFYHPPADGATCVHLPLQLQPTTAAQTHVATSIDDSFNFIIKAHCALSIFASLGFRRKHWRYRWTQRRARSRH